MHIHILGICGTFMGSLAVLAKEMGIRVSGSDANVYPPMSTQLEAQGIVLSEGFDPAHLQPAPDLVVIGNAMSRGNPAVEYVLNQGLPYCSGPEFLANHILPGKWVLAVSGTHGKTTTSAMLAWILEYANMKPGYLIGGVLNNFSTSARLGGSDFFVVEADEYDSAFFDKRSKFVHYRPRTLIINNLEFDHADIFPDLAAIQRQFHHLIRTVPSEGQIICPAAHPDIEQVLAQGCWTPVQRFESPVNKATEPQEMPARSTNQAPPWQVRLHNNDGSEFDILVPSDKGASDVVSGRVNWSLSGQHNVSNALAAVMAARHVGVDIQSACDALSEFSSVKRRMELRGEVGKVSVYDDFAHHPTAIETTLDGMRARLAEQPGSRLIAVIEPRSATMKMGVHQHTLAAACHAADICLWKDSEENGLDMDSIIQSSPAPALSFVSVADIVTYLATHSRPGDHIVIMSNGGFDNIHQRLLDALSQRDSAPEEV